MTTLSFIPRFDGESIDRELGRLFVPGPFVDDTLSRRIASLENHFRVYAAQAPFGLWGPGLVVTDEMRRLTEAYLPLAEIRSAFDRLQRHALAFSPYPGTSLLQGAESWLDVLPRLPRGVAAVNPAAILRRLRVDAAERCRFLFALYLPDRFGGGFGRYPLQAAFLRSWLADSRRRLDRIRCLDAACGSGEGTYELAGFVFEEGFHPSRISVEGTTVGELEVFAAAHAFFPGDPPRQEAYRRKIAALAEAGVTETMRFGQEDLSSGMETGRVYDVILCNGFVGGPFLHEQERVAGVVGKLAGRLARGGVLLMADRFHAGWKKKVPKETLEEAMRRSGLKILAAPEGVAGVQS